MNKLGNIVARNLAKEEAKIYARKLGRKHAEEKQGTREESKQVARNTLGNVQEQ